MPAGRVVIVSPGIEHAIFGPGDRCGARQAMASTTTSRWCYSPDAYRHLRPDVRSRACSNERTTCSLLVVGGASGSNGHAPEKEMRLLADELGLSACFVAPQPPPALDVLPGRRRRHSCRAGARASVNRLEAAACGAPVVPSAVRVSFAR